MRMCQVLTKLNITALDRECNYGNNVAMLLCIEFRERALLHVVSFAFLSLHQKYFHKGVLMLTQCI